MFLEFSGDALRARRLRLWILGTVLWVVAGPLSAQQAPFFSPTLEVAARSAVLMNAMTGEILFAKEPNLRLPPASTTKVLTALVALDRLDPNARLPVSAQAASVAPSRIGLRAGEMVTMQDLMYGLLLKSGNDAAETLAEAAGGSVYQFAGLMNAKAWQIGARNSHFTNPHGLPDDDHYSTVYDLALVFRWAMHYPLFSDIVRTRTAALRIESGSGPYGDWRMVPVHSTNRLLASYEGTRGGKTGFTFKARHCFVGEVDRGGIPLIVAIFNSPSRGTLWQDARNLLDYGFSRYGLAPPPPVRVEPEPVMARHIPVITPRAARAAVVRTALAGKQGHAVARRGMAASAKTPAAKMQTTRKKSVAKAAVTKPSAKVARGSRGKKPATAVAVKPVKPVKPGTKIATIPTESNGKPRKNKKQRI